MAKIRTAQSRSGVNVHIETSLPVEWEEEILRAADRFARNGYEGQLVVTAHGPSVERSHGKFVLRYDAVYGDVFALNPRSLREHADKRATRRANRRTYRGRH